MSHAADWASQTSQQMFSSGNPLISTGFGAITRVPCKLTPTAQDFGGDKIS